MKKLCSKVVIAIQTLALMASCFCTPTFSSKCSEPINTSMDCSLKLTYRDKKTKFNDIEIKIYKVADVSWDTVYTLCDNFKNFPVNINLIASQKEWNQTAFTFYSYISANKTEPNYTAFTNSSGTALFSDIPCGLYIISPIKSFKNNINYNFDPFMVSLPDCSENKNEWNYNLSAFPKSIRKIPTFKEVKYTAKKIWDDGSDSSKRPENIKIEIFKNGNTFKEVTLSSSNNWYYEWDTIDDGNEWTVIEKNVDPNYKVSINKQNLCFGIINSAPIYNSEIPKTGDNDNIFSYISILAFCGVSILIFDFIDKKKKENKCLNKK